MTFEGLLIQLLNGLTIGAVLMLLSMGLTLIFGLMGIVNFAHGAVYMLGAYVCLETVRLTGSFWFAAAVSPLLVGLFGYLLDRTVIRKLHGRNPLQHVLLTFGVAVVLSEIVKIVWGPQIQSVAPPESLSGSLLFLGIQYPGYRIAVLSVAALVALAIWFILRQTNIGLMIRSGTHDQAMVEALGINVRSLFTGVFVAGTALAALAGVLIGPLRSIHPQMGTDVIVYAFIAVIVGGLGSVGGAAAGAMLVGIMEVLGALYLPDMANAGVYATVVLVLIAKPNGLFGRRAVQP